MDVRSTLYSPTVRTSKAARTEPMSTFRCRNKSRTIRTTRLAPASKTRRREKTEKKTAAEHRGGFFSHVVQWLASARCFPGMDVDHARRRVGSLRNGSRYSAEDLDAGYRVAWEIPQSAEIAHARAIDHGHLGIGKPHVYRA